MTKTYFYERNKSIANNFKSYSRIDPVTNPTNNSIITFSINNFDIIEDAYIVFKYNENIPITVNEYLESIDFRLNFEKQRILEEIENFEYQDIYNSIFSKIDLDWNNHENWSDIDIYKFDITKKYLDIWELLQSITNADNIDLNLKLSVIQEYQNLEYIKVTKKRFYEPVNSYTITLNINDNVVSKYTEKEYNKVITLNSNGKRGILHEMNKEKNTIYHDILYFHKTNLQKLPNENFKIIIESSCTNLDHIYILIKKVYISSIEKILINNENRMIPDFEKISILAKRLNVIELNFSGKCCILVINITNHDISIIDDIQLIVDNIQINKLVNILNIYETKCTFNNQFIIYKFSLYPFQLNYAKSDACDLSKILNKTLTVSLVREPNPDSYIEVMALNYSFI